MNYNLTAYLIYFLLILFVILYVGSVLYRNGEPFIVNMFKGDRTIAVAVNKFLLAGYYLINMGYSIMVLKGWEKVLSFSGMLETLGQKAGAILLFLGIMHFFNILTLIFIGKKRKEPYNTVLTFKNKRS